MATRPAPSNTKSVQVRSMEESSTSSTAFRSASSNHDVLVMRTAEDAVRAKHAAAKAGYYQDPFVSAFAPRKNAAQHPQVQVIIKRGTFARVACVHKALVNFIDETTAAEQCAQVVVLGCGKDTSFFRVVDEHRRTERRHGGLRWFDVDHGEVLREKTDVIGKSPAIFGATVCKSNEYTFQLQSADSVKPWNSLTCHLIAHNLSEDHDILVHHKLVQAGMDPTLPTLLVMECVQMYLPVIATASLLKAFTSSCPDCVLVSYEPILGYESAFGRMMQDNLTKVGVVIPDSGLVQIRILRQMLAHLASAGFVRGTSCDMFAAYETVLSAAQRTHAQRCEFLDELEEFSLIMRHYCFVVASSKPDSVFGAKMCDVGEASLLGFVSGRCDEL